MGPFTSSSIEELVQHCAVFGETAAWEEFVRRFHRLIAKVILRVAIRYGDSSKETVDDLIQETYLKLCANNYRLLKGFEHRHPDAFIGYVQVVAANVVRDHFKLSYNRKRSRNQISSIPDDSISITNEGSGSPLSIERSVLLDEIRRNLDFCVGGEDRERVFRVFWLYYRSGLSAAAIATLPEVGLTTKGVESLILRTTRELKKRIASRSAGETAMDPNAAKGVLPAESF